MVWVCGFTVLVWADVFVTFAFLLGVVGCGWLSEAVSSEVVTLLVSVFGGLVLEGFGHGCGVGGRRAGGGLVGGVSVGLQCSYALCSPLHAGPTPRSTGHRCRLVHRSPNLRCPLFQNVQYVLARRASTSPWQGVSSGLLLYSFLPRNVCSCFMSCGLEWRYRS